MNNEIIKFNNGNLELDVTVTPDKDTVWLSANQMALLFDRDEKTIRKHINNIFKDREVEKENNTQKMRVKKWMILLTESIIPRNEYRTNLVPTGHEIGSVTMVSGEILAFFMSFCTSKNNFKKLLKSCPILSLPIQSICSFFSVRLSASL